MGLVPIGKIFLTAKKTGQHAEVMYSQDYSALVVANNPAVKSTGSNAVWEMYGNAGSTGQVAFKNGNCFASGRFGDWYGKLQVQAPGSADWITRAQGDETCTLYPLGMGDFAIHNPMYNAFVSVRFDEPDGRAGNGYPLSLKKNMNFFGGSVSGGTPVTAVGEFETFSGFFGGAQDCKIVMKAAANNPDRHRFGGYNHYSGCDLSEFDFSGMDLSNYDFTNANLQHSDFRNASSLDGIRLAGANVSGAHFPSDFDVQAHMKNG